jgi:RimJ/RimL family protein N-acetyltransferase
LSRALRSVTERRYHLGMSEPDFQPTLTGPTVIARPVTSGDWAELFAAGSDPEIWKVHPRSDRYTEPAFREYFESAVASGMGFVFVDRPTNRLIGSSRYYGYDAGRSEIEIGWTFIARSHWGGTTNREVKRLMLDHAFTFVDRYRDLLGRRAKLALPGRDDQDRRRQARWALYPGSDRRNAAFHLRNRQKPIPERRPGAGRVTLQKAFSRLQDSPTTKNPGIAAGVLHC